MATESFFSNASLAYLASAGAGKDGKTYSIKPNDGSGDFTFSRGSNLAATRVGPTGLIEKGRENLLLYSEQFDNPYYVKSLGTLTENQTTAPDGSLTADLFTKTSAVNTASGLNKNSPIYSSTGVYTYSVYVKQNVGNDVLLRLDAAGNTANAIFQFSTKSISPTGSNVIDATAIELSDGWFRLSVTGNVTSTAWSISIINLFANPTNDSVFVWGAQLEVGLAATEVITTGATTGKAGLLEDEPRFDYSGGATCPSLLLEPSRTNLVRQSEYIHGYGVKVGCTTTSNYGTSPEGLVNSTRLEFTSNGYTYEAIPQVIGTQYTISVYAKRNDGGTQSFGFFVDGSGTIDSAMALTNEWKRFDYTYTATNAYYFGFAGNSGADVSVYGFQVEEGSYPTSYIPNHSGGSVTRGADSCVVNNTTSSIGQTEGTMFLDFVYDNNGGGFYGSYVANANGFTDFVGWRINDNKTTLDILIRYNNTYQVLDSVLSVFAVGNRYKVALKYSSGDIKVFVNNQEKYSSTATYTTPSVPLSKHTISGNNANLVDSLQQDTICKVNQSILFPTALSDADCINITSL